MNNDVFKNAIDSLQLAKSTLESQLQAINKAIQSLSGEEVKNEMPLVNKVEDLKSDTNQNETLDYSKDWFLPKKFLFFLQREKRFLHFREAAEYLIQIEGIEGDKEALCKEFSSRLSSATQTMKKSGEIVKIQSTAKVQDTFWGSPNWLDEKGRVKKGHEFNEKYLSINLGSLKGKI